MAGERYDEAVWQQAVNWIIREHEGALDEQEHRALVAWITEAPHHRDAYEEAARVWLIAGLVPPGGDDSN